MAGENLFTEPLNGGLVNVRDPSLLRPGELVQCDDVHYYPNDQAIYKVKGRNKYNTVSMPSGAQGLRHLLFDDAPDVILAHYSSTYAYSLFVDEQETASPAFTVLASTIGQGATLDAVHYNNKHYLLNGIHADFTSNATGPNQVLKSNLVMRRMGLSPVVSWSDVPPSLVAGSWPDDATMPLGWYFFIFTEVHDGGGSDEIESTFTGTPQAINVTASNKGVLLTFPTILTNAGTETDTTPLINKRRVYMSTQQGETTQVLQPGDPPLSAYALVAEVDVAALTVTITNSGANSGSLKLPTLTASVVSGWSNISNATNDNNTGAQSTAPAGKFVAYQFGLSIAGVITGIEVEVKLKGVPGANGAYNRDNGVLVQLTKTAAGTNTGVGAARLINFLGFSYAARLLGGAHDTWGAGLLAGDITPAAFGVLVTAVLPGVGQVNVDYIKVKVYAEGGTALEYGVPFPTISIQIGGVLYVEGSHGPPPVASTGDVFESQMVVNNIQDPSRVQYSLPDGVEYFPPSYYLNFESKEQDEVMCIRRLGNKLIVGLKHQIYRVNYLPRESDAEFDRGRSVEAIAEDHGIVGTQSAALFSPPEKPMLLAYVSANGVHATDGYQTTTLTEDLDWDTMVRKEYLHNCVLVNYPKLYILALYYTPPGQTTKTKALYFHYHPSHVKEGQKLVVTGPITVATQAATVARLNNEYLLMTTGPPIVSNNWVYIEDREYDDDAGTGINVAIRTRDIYGAGIGYEFTIERVWVRHMQHVSPISVPVVNLYWRNTESALAAPNPNTDATQAFGTTFLGLSRLDNMHSIGEAVVFEVILTDGGVANRNGLGISYIAYEAAGHGLEESNQS